MLVFKKISLHPKLFLLTIHLLVGHNFVHCLGTNCQVLNYNVYVSNPIQPFVVLLSKITSLKNVWEKILEESVWKLCHLKVIQYLEHANKMEYVKKNLILKSYK